jgi:NADPH:quinone reductase-like Zn-dependent oxidoreductase
VGRFAVQLAKLWGLTVIGTAGPSRLDDLRELGVQAVAYGDGWEGRVRAVLPAPDRQVDLVLDTTGKGMLAGSLRLVESAAQVLTIADPDAAKLGVRFSSGSDADGQADSLQAVVRAVADDGVSVPIAATFPLERAADAHRLSEAGHAGGKIVLLPQERA